MQLHEISSLGGKSKRRVGRGGKRGTTSGRGTKGQKSRAGHVIRPALRDLIIKIPKKRGYQNKSIVDKPLVLNLSDLSKLEVMAEKGKVLSVDKTVLKQANMIPSGFRKGTIKVLGNGEIKFPISVKDLKVSVSAKEKIEKAGGKVE